MFSLCTIAVLSVVVMLIPFNANKVLLFLSIMLQTGPSWLNKNTDFVESSLALFLVAIHSTELFLLKFIVYTAMNEHLSNGNSIQQK